MRSESVNLGLLCASDRLGMCCMRFIVLIYEVLQRASMTRPLLSTCLKVAYLRNRLEAPQISLALDHSRGQLTKLSDQNATIFSL